MIRLNRWRSYISVVVAVIVRPSYWAVALRVIRRLAPRGWWQRAPFLPVPSESYARFRLQTQYGGETPVPTSADVLKYLQWVRQWDAGR